MTEKRIEVMAPVGSFEALEAAIGAGCDSIYFGVEQLNMRSRAASNFTREELPELAERCQSAGVRMYLTMNTLLYDHDMSLMRDILAQARDVSVSAVIVSDMAAIQVASELGVPVHCSTQLSISNYETVKFYSRFAETIVLARELDLRMVKRICDQIKAEDLRGPGGDLVQIEIFGHGALCVAQSGRCGMSQFQYNASGNRGACLQPCRREYRITDKETGESLDLEDGFVLSPQDLCTIGILPEVVDAGVAVLKIEGRGREPLYVKRTVECYREALDAIAEGTYTPEKVEGWRERLETVYHRGLGEGWYMGKSMPELAGIDGSQATQKKFFVGEVVNYYRKIGVAEVQVQARGFQSGEPFVCIGSKTGAVEGVVAGLRCADQEVGAAEPKTVVTLRVPDRVRIKDKFFVLEERAG